jgi:hypothetical protein
MAGVRHRHKTVTDDPQARAASPGSGFSVSVDMQALHAQSVR